MASQIEKLQLIAKNDPNKNSYKPQSRLAFLFHEHLRVIKDEMRQRKMLNQLTNQRTTRKDQVELIRIEDVSINSMKPQDKKRLL